MLYELIPNSSVGVITDTSPVFRDVKDTFAVSFILPEPGEYIALFRDESGTEYRASIKDGAAKVPKQLLTKEQRIGLLSISIGFTFAEKRNAPASACGGGKSNMTVRSQVWKTNRAHRKRRTRTAKPTRKSARYSKLWTTIRQWDIPNYTASFAQSTHIRGTI